MDIAPWRGHYNPLWPSQPIVAITTHCGHCSLAWALHPIAGITPHRRHHIPSWASHHGVGITSHCGHHNPSRASHRSVSAAPYGGHRTLAWASQPVAGIQVTRGSPQEAPRWAGRGGGGISRVVPPTGSTKPPGGKRNLFPRCPTCRGNVPPGNGPGRGGYYSCNNELLISPEDSWWRREHGICPRGTTGWGEKKNQTPTNL